MDLLLTPIVQRLLQRFVKSSDEGSGRDLKVSLSRAGAIVLNNLALDLEPLLDKVPSLQAKRAFARQLTINIPWTALTSQPIQIVLDTVELVLVPRSPDTGNNNNNNSYETATTSSQPLTEEDPAINQPSTTNTASSSWFSGALQSISLHAGLNISLLLNNVLVKIVSPSSIRDNDDNDGFTAALAFQSLHLSTSQPGEWQDNLAHPEAWLKKDLEIRNVSLLLEHSTTNTGWTNTHSSSSSSSSSSFPPLLRSGGATISILLPVWSYLEDVDLMGDPFSASAHVRLSKIDICVDDKQLKWASLIGRMFNTGTGSVVNSGTDALLTSSSQQQQDATSNNSMREGSQQQQAEIEDRDPHRHQRHRHTPLPGKRKKMLALGVFNKVWDYVIDEVAYHKEEEDDDEEEEEEEEDDDEGLQQQRQRSNARLPPIQADSTLIVEGLNIRLAKVRMSKSPLHHVVDDKGECRTLSRTTSSQIEAVPDLAALLEKLKHVKSPAEAAGLQTELRDALMAAAQDDIDDGSHSMGSTKLVDAGTTIERNSSNNNREAHSHPLAVLEPLADLNVGQMDCSVSSLDDSLQSLDIALESCSLVRNCYLNNNTDDNTSNGISDELFGLHRGSSSQGDEKSGGAALHARWQAAGVGEGGASIDVPRASVQLAQLYVAAVPGFFPEISEFLSPVVSLGNSNNSSSANSVEQNSKQQQDDNNHNNSTNKDSSSLNLLNSKLLLEVELHAFQLALLSTPYITNTTALTISFSQVQCRTGSLNWNSSWNRHMRESMLAPSTGFSGHGLRFNVAAATIGVATPGRWKPVHPRYALSLDCGGDDDGGTVREGSQILEEFSIKAVCGNYEDSLLASFALSTMSFKLSGAQLGAAIAAISSVKNQLQAGLFSTMAIVHQADASPGWLRSISATYPAMQAMYSAHTAGIQQSWISSSSSSSQLPSWPTDVSLYLQCTHPASVALTVLPTIGSTSSHQGAPVPVSEVKFHLVLLNPGMLSSPSSGTEYRTMGAQLSLAVMKKKNSTITTTTVGENNTPNVSYVDEREPLMLVNDLMYSSNGVNIGNISVCCIGTEYWDAFSTLVGSIFNQSALPSVDYMEVLGAPIDISSTDKRSEGQQKVGGGAIELIKQSDSTYAIGSAIIILAPPPSSSIGLEALSVHVAKLSYASTSETGAINCTVGSLHASLIPIDGMDTTIKDDELSSEEFQVLQWPLTTEKHALSFGIKAEKYARVLNASAAALLLRINPTVYNIINSITAAFFPPSSVGDDTAAMPSQVPAPPPPPPLSPIHGRLLCDRIEMYLTTEEDNNTTSYANSTTNSTKPFVGCYAMLAIDQIAAVVHQSSLREGRPWLFASSSPLLSTSIEGSLLGVEFIVDPGLDIHNQASSSYNSSKRRQLSSRYREHHRKHWILPPTDIVLEAVGHNAAVVIALRMPLLPVHVYMPCIVAVQYLVGSIVPPSSPSSISTSSSATTKQHHPHIMNLSMEDDLRSGMFRLVSDKERGEQEQTSSSAAVSSTATTTPQQQNRLPRPLEVWFQSVKPSSITASASSVFSWGSSSTQATPTYTDDGNTKQQHHPQPDSDEKELIHSLTWSYPVPWLVENILIGNSINDDDDQQTQLPSDCMVSYYDFSSADWIEVPVHYHKEEEGEERSKGTCLSLTTKPSEASMNDAEDAEDDISQAACSWQLTWTGTLSSAQTILQHLYINPRSTNQRQQKQQQTQPCAAPLTVLLHADACMIDLLAPVSSISPDVLDPAFTVDFRSFQVQMHQWKDNNKNNGGSLLAVDLDALCSVECMGSLALSGVPFIEPFRARVAIEVGPSLIYDDDKQGCEGTIAAHSSLPPSSSSLIAAVPQIPIESHLDVASPTQLLAASIRKYPQRQQQQPCTAIYFACSKDAIENGISTPTSHTAHLGGATAEQREDHDIHQIKINMSELVAHDLTRALASLTSSLSSSSSSSGEHSSHPPMLLVNETGIDLRVKQQGVVLITGGDNDRSVLVKEGSIVPFWWPMLPGGTVRRRLQVTTTAAFQKRTNTSGGEGTKGKTTTTPNPRNHWSRAFECMHDGSVAMLNLPFPTPSSSSSSSAAAADQCPVAVSVKKGAGGRANTWVVTFKPGIKVVNYTGHSIVCHCNYPTAQLVKVGAGQSQHVRLSNDETTGRYSKGCSSSDMVQEGMLRMWLPGRNHWSVPLKWDIHGGNGDGGGDLTAAMLNKTTAVLHQDLPLTTLPPPPPSSLVNNNNVGDTDHHDHHDHGVVLAQTSRSTDGQLIIGLWPAAVLKNTMPCPVWIKHSVEEEEEGITKNRGIATLEDENAWIEVKPDRIVPLKVPQSGGKFVQLSLHQHQRQKQGNTVTLMAPQMTTTSTSLDKGGGVSRGSVPNSPMMSFGSTFMMNSTSSTNLASGASSNTNGNNAGFEDETCFLPPPGEGMSFNLSCFSSASDNNDVNEQEQQQQKQQSVVECVLLTEQPEECLPVLQLKLVAPVVVRNTLPVAITIHQLFNSAANSTGSSTDNYNKTGEDQAVMIVPPMSEIPITWTTVNTNSSSTDESQKQQQQQQVKVERIHLSMMMTMEGSPSSLRSRYPLGLDKNGMFHVVLDSQSAAAYHKMMVKKNAAGSSNKGSATKSRFSLFSGLRSSSTTGDDNDADNDSNVMDMNRCYKKVHVAVQVKLGQLLDGLVETLHVTLSPGCFVSNLTGMPLDMLEGGAYLVPGDNDSDGGGCGTAGENNSLIELADGATAPLFCAWQSSANDAAATAAAAGTGHRHARSWSGSKELFKSFTDSLSGSSHSTSIESISYGSLYQGQGVRVAISNETAAAAAAAAATTPPPTARNHQFAPPKVLSTSDIKLLLDTNSGNSNDDDHQRYWSQILSSMPLSLLQQPYANGRQNSSTARGGGPIPTTSHHQKYSTTSTRKRIHVRHPDTGHVTMLTQRTLSHQGRFHLVLFRDRQPPYILKNNLVGTAIEVAYFPPVHLLDNVENDTKSSGNNMNNGGGGDTGWTHSSQPSACIRLDPGQELEYDFPSSLGSGSSSGGGGGRQDGVSSSMSKNKTPAGMNDVNEMHHMLMDDGDPEDEDAFLDSLLHEDDRLDSKTNKRKNNSPSGGKATADGFDKKEMKMEAVMKMRLLPGSGADTHGWMMPFVLVPGMYSLDGKTIAVVTKSCVTTHVVFLTSTLMEGEEGEEDDDANALPTTASVISSQSHANASTTPLSAFLKLDSIQVCLWDDERGRFSPTSRKGRGGGGGGGRKSRKKEYSSPIAQELFAWTIDQLSAAFHKTTLTRMMMMHHHQQQQEPQLVDEGYIIKVNLHGIQCDSFLVDSEHPVVLTSLAESGEFPGSSLLSDKYFKIQQQAANKKKNKGNGEKYKPLLTIEMDIRQSRASTSSTESIRPSSTATVTSFRNTWIHKLFVKLPILAVGVDDALLVFVDGAKATLSGTLPCQQSSLESEMTMTGSSSSNSSPGLYHFATLTTTTNIELAAEARNAAGSRLYVASGTIEPVRVLLDVHVSAGTAGIPVSIDTHRSPLALSRISVENILFRPDVLMRGLAAHGMAEALLSAPGVLGSLQLLFNPTGFVTSLRQGMSDLVGLPLAAWQAGSASQFLAGLGLGTASFLKHISGWTLTSISGFSFAFARAVDAAVTRRGGGTAAAGHSSGTNTIGGLQDFIMKQQSPITSANNITSISSSSSSSNSSESGVLAGIGRGLLGAVSLPVSGALGLLGSAAAGIATSTGITQSLVPKRSARELDSNIDGEDDTDGDDPMLVVVSSTGAATLTSLIMMGHGDAATDSHSNAITTAAIATADNKYVGVGLYRPLMPLIIAKSIIIYKGAPSAVEIDKINIQAIYNLQAPPAVLLTGQGLVLFANGGLDPALLMPMEGLVVVERESRGEVVVFSKNAVPVGGPKEAVGRAAVAMEMDRLSWLRMVPLLRRVTC